MKAGNILFSMLISPLRKFNFRLLADSKRKYRTLKTSTLAKNLCIICKGVPAPSPFLRNPPLDPARHLFKSFVSHPLFLIPAPFKVFKTVPSTLTQLSPALIQHTNFPYT